MKFHLDTARGREIFLEFLEDTVPMGDVLWTKALLDENEEVLRSNSYELNLIRRFDAVRSEVEKMLVSEQSRGIGTCLNHAHPAVIELLSKGFYARTRAAASRPEPRA